MPGQCEIGVIVGRFQCPELHAAHRDLIEIVMARHTRRLILLGVPPIQSTRRNPLDYQTRLEMFRAEYPEFVVMPLPDLPTDEMWSNELDRRVREAFPEGKVTLYGGRDSFVQHYTGAFETSTVVQKSEFSASAMRESAAVAPLDTRDFRAGVIYATSARPALPVMCVDIAVLRDTGREMEILLIRKPNEKAWRLIGGVVDPTDTSLEHSCRREVSEETGVEAANYEYAGSRPVGDWRLRGTETVAFTALFCAEYAFGVAKGGDDAGEAAWFNLARLVNDPAGTMEPYHVPLVDMVNKWLSRGR